MLIDKRLRMAAMVAVGCVGSTGVASVTVTVIFLVDELNTMVTSLAFARVITTLLSASFVKPVVEVSALYPHELFQVPSVILNLYSPAGSAL